MEGIWKEFRNLNGEVYEFCGCGMVVWNRASKCPMGHPRGYVFKRKLRKRRFSGHSAFQDKIGGFQQSGRA